MKYNGLFDAYRTEGSAARDIYATPLPKNEPKTSTFVEHSSQPVPAVEVVRIKSPMSVLTVTIIALFAVCAAMYLYFDSSVEGNERAMRLMQREASEVHRETINARAVIRNSYNLAEVEAMAPRLGLAMPQEQEIVRIYIPR